MTTLYFEACLRQCECVSRRASNLLCVHSENIMSSVCLKCGLVVNTFSFSVLQKEKLYLNRIFKFKYLNSRPHSSA
jgi:hypothetical protein